MSQSTSVDILDQLDVEKLDADTQDALTHLRDRTDTDAELQAKLTDIQREVAEADRMQDAKEADIRLKALTQTLQGLREEMQQEEVDLAQAVLGLNAKIESMGAEYANLNQPSAEETAVIEKAEAALRRAQAAIPDEDAERARIEKMWFEFRRAKARSVLEAKLVGSKKDVELSKARLEEAKIEAKRMARQRLMSADMQQSLQEFTLRVEKTIDIMEHRVSQIVEQLRGVTAQKDYSFEIYERAAAKRNELEQAVQRAEADLRQLEDELGSLVKGTEEYATKEKEVSDKRADVEELTGKHNTALTLAQSKERFAKELEIHERTQMKLRDNMKMWVTMLRSDTEARVTTFKSRLEAMKAMSDQDVARDLDKLGVAIDKANVDFMVQAGAVSDRVRMDRVEKHPEIFAQIIKAQAAQAEAIAEIKKRERAAIERFKEQYGIDPSITSWATYLSPEEGCDEGDTPSGLL
jgi:hypothetical protein